MQCHERDEAGDRLVKNGDLEKAIRLEAYNRQLGNALGADRCHNVDRIMRLPGTVNVPNKKKRDNGREPVVAKLVAFIMTGNTESTGFKCRDGFGIPDIGRETGGQAD